MIAAAGGSHTTRFERFTFQASGSAGGIDPNRPSWMNLRLYRRLPEMLSVRELKVEVRQKGFRCRHLYLVTTLLDAQHYSDTDLAMAFRARWHAELDLRSIKHVMQMDVLRCKSPAMVRKEIWMHLLAYSTEPNLMEVPFGSWPIFLTTPVSDWAILWGKFLGAVRQRSVAGLPLFAHVGAFTVFGMIHPFGIMQLTIVVAFLTSLRLPSAPPRLIWLLSAVMKLARTRNTAA